MPGETTRAPLSSWSRPVVLAVALAYRTSLGERSGAREAYDAATAAFLAAGADPALAAGDAVLIAAAVARGHPDWLYGPCRARIAREEAYWRGRGVWPPPKDRSAWRAGP
jgi:hypothetical protein